MKKNLILISSLVLMACGEDKTVNQSSASTPVQQVHIAKNGLKDNDINGRWTITKITGGPATIYPGGKNMPGLQLDLNQVWQGGVFEFYDGITFLTLPSVKKEQIGGYTIQGNTIIVEGSTSEKQNMVFSLKDNLMTMTLQPEEYIRMFNNAAAGGASKLEVASPIIFHLSKQQSSK